MFSVERLICCKKQKLCSNRFFLGLESGTAIETRFLESPLSDIERLWQEIKQLREKIDGLRQRVEDLEIEYIEFSESNEESSYTTTASISSAENMEPMNGF